LFEGKHKTAIDIHLENSHTILQINASSLIEEHLSVLYVVHEALSSWSKENPATATIQRPQKQLAQQANTLKRNNMNSEQCSC